MNTTFFRFLNKSSKFCNYSLRENVSRKRLTQSHCRKMSTNLSISISKEKETFQDVLPCIIESLQTDPKLAAVPEVAKWITKVLDYNLTGGKKTRGITTIFAYEMFEKPENITEESMKLARIMGWCVEMLQAYLLVVDDIMDNSLTRRGVPCWYRLPDVGYGAINDSILIYTSIFQILKKYFGEMPQYPDIVDLFNETLLYTSIGQHLDFTMSHRNEKDYSLFTIERYEAIVTHKTAYYTYKGPVCLGLLLSNITDAETLKKVEEITLEIGKFFQIQDDYIDCYSDEAVKGKTGTDIQEGKCSWLAVMALQRCNAAQRSVFEQHYGSKDPADVDRIKQLYDQLDLPRIFHDQERALYDDIVRRSEALSRETDLSPKLFLKLVDMIYNRKQ